MNMKSLLIYTLLAGSVLSINTTRSLPVSEMLGDLKHELIQIRNSETTKKIIKVGKISGITLLGLYSACFLYARFFDVTERSSSSAAIMAIPQAIGVILDNSETFFNNFNYTKPIGDYIHHANQNFRDNVYRPVLKMYRKNWVK